MRSPGECIKQKLPRDLSLYCSKDIPRVAVRRWADVRAGASAIIAFVTVSSCGSGNPNAYLIQAIDTSFSGAVTVCAAEGSALTAHDFVVRRLYNSNCPPATDVRGGDEGLNSWILLRNPAPTTKLTECAALSDDVPTIFAPSCGGQDGKLNAFSISFARIHVDGEWSDLGNSHYSLDQQGDTLTSSGSYGAATGKFTGPYTLTLSWSTATWTGVVDPSGEFIVWNNASKWFKQH